MTIIKQRVECSTAYNTRPPCTQSLLQASVRDTAVAVYAILLQASVRDTAAVYAMSDIAYTAAVGTTVVYWAP